MEIAFKQILKFSSNWNNKLHNRYFTSIRIYNPAKYDPGNIYQVQAKGMTPFDVQLIDAKPIMLHEINEWIAGLDTGYSAEETKSMLLRMYKNKADLSKKHLHFLLFKRMVK